LVCFSRSFVRSQASDSSTRMRMKSASSAGIAAQMNSPRQPAIGSTRKKAIAASR